MREGLYLFEGLRTRSGLYLAGEPPTGVAPGSNKLSNSQNSTF